MRTAVLISLLAAGCGGGDRELTNLDAIAAANGEMVEFRPDFGPVLGGMDIEVRLMRNNQWRVAYTGGTGGVVVEVDKRTGHAEIVRIDQ